MRAGRKYWLCQVIGWGLYSLLGVEIAAQGAHVGATLLIGYSAFFLYSIALTHAFRYVILHRRWALAITLPGALRLFAGALFVGAIQSFLVVWVDLEMEKGRSVFLTEPAAGWGMWANVTIASMVWTALYVLLTYTRRNKERDVTLELLRRETELRTLESKINPHFLFNCLNSIRGLVSEDPARAQEMITRLADILRYSLNRDLNRLVPLAEEAHVASDYLALESVRFESRLRVRFEIAPEAENALIPPMLLQTLVENALKHGIARLPEGGEVRIRGEARAANLVLAVENTGRLAQASGGAGVGLQVARERIRLLYNGRGKLELSERTDEGVQTVAAVATVPRQE